MMNEATPYSLAPDGMSSENYYRCVGEFADEVMKRASTNIIASVREYTAFLRAFQLEEIRCDEEYVLELLSFGMLWKRYGRRALDVRFAPFLTLANMAEWRKKHPRWKAAIDVARGVLITLFLFHSRDDNTPAKEHPTKHDADRLCRWLDATGEFREPAIRFILWRAYWESMPEERWKAGAAAVFEFTDWFIAHSEAALGRYTANVDRFLSETHDRYRWREDRVQCTRSRAEYHLNMVGAELMNRAFRNSFTSTDTTALLVPGCMRGKPETECKAVRGAKGLLCSGCLPSCNVNRMREMGKKQGFETYIIPHASDLSLWSPRDGEPSRGVVAVACVTNLVEGGWELKRYDVPAQCVLLDYSGCKKHWHDTGITTTLNIRELKRRMGRKSNHYIAFR